MTGPRFRDRHPVGARFLMLGYALLVAGTFAVAAVVAARLSSESPTVSGSSALPRPSVTTDEIGPLSATPSAGPSAVPTGSPTPRPTAAATHKAKSSGSKSSGSGSGASSGSSSGSGTTSGTITRTRPTTFPSGGFRGPFPSASISSRWGPGGW